jgi:hypothetical protein
MCKSCFLRKSKGLAHRNVAARDKIMRHCQGRLTFSTVEIIEVCGEHTRAEILIRFIMIIPPPPPQSPSLLLTILPPIVAFEMIINNTLLRTESDGIYARRQ